MSGIDRALQRDIKNLSRVRRKGTASFVIQLLNKSAESIIDGVGGFTYYRAVRSLMKTSHYTISIRGRNPENN
jgi:hypothetical protein